MPAKQLLYDEEARRAILGGVDKGRKTVTAGANPMALKRGIDKAVEAVIAEITKLSN